MPGSYGQRSPGRVARQPNSSYRSVGIGPLPLVADFVKELTILDISSPGRVARQPNSSYRSAGIGPLPLVAGFVKELTILGISSSGKSIRAAKALGYCFRFTVRATYVKLCGSFSPPG